MAPASRPSRGAWLWAGVLAFGLAQGQAQASAPKTEATASAAQDRPELYQDQPPPTLWDRRHEVDADGSPSLKVSDNQGLITQIVRTLVALCGVLFLLWAFARVIGPRMGRVLGAKRALGMQVVDRLSLDGRNTLVKVTLADQTSYLIACGDHSVTLIDKTGPGSAAAERPTAFAQRMGAQLAPEE